MPKTKKQDPIVTAPVATPEAETAPVTEPVVTVPTDPIYVVGKTPKLGNGNMHDTKRTWDFMAAHLTENGPQTVAAMQKLAKDEYNHASFIKYAVKNGWYVVTTAEAELAKAEQAKADAEALLADAAEK